MKLEWNWQQQQELSHYNEDGISTTWNQTTELYGWIPRLCELLNKKGICTTTECWGIFESFIYGETSNKIKTVWLTYRGSESVAFILWVGIWKPHWMVSVPTNHKVPETKQRVLDWKYSVLHLLDMYINYHRLRVMYVSNTHKKSRYTVTLVQTVRWQCHEIIGKSLGQMPWTIC